MIEFIIYAIAAFGLGLLYHSIYGSRKERRLWMTANYVHWRNHYLGQIKHYNHLVDEYGHDPKLSKEIAHFREECQVYKRALEDLEDDLGKRVRRWGTLANA